MPSIAKNHPDPIDSAADAGLIYVSHHRPGITRRRNGKGFEFFDPKGARLKKNGEEVRRIKSLVIPPAWKDVWICPSPRGHIQAVGTDARGRTQYRYHPKWRQTRDESKYGRMIPFGKILPKIRAGVRRHLKLRGLPREKVLAVVVTLLETTLIRVGNERYSKDNKSFGLTTLHDHHVNVTGSKVHFEFRGKSGVHRVVDIQDKRLAKIIRSCQDLPQQELFAFLDETGQTHDIMSTDVNEYLKQVSGEDFTAKDFRTWAGTILAATALKEFKPFGSQAQAKRNVVAAIESVAQQLGNTKAVCRKCYIHPDVIQVYLEGTLTEGLQKQGEQRLKRSAHRLDSDEAAVLAFLQSRLKK